MTGPRSRLRVQDAVEHDFDGAVEVLNLRLRNAIEALERMPGRAEAVVAIPPAYRLAFIRAKEGWTIFLASDDPEGRQNYKEWHKCSVEEKALIAGALPSLLEEMLAVSSTRRSALKIAHDGMDRFEAMLKQQKEGA
ncbi:MAG: hypothetical protein ACKVU4_05180 [Phycisphaerales bacterium]